MATIDDDLAYFEFSSFQKQKSLKNRPNEESEFLPCLILYFDLHWCSEVKINSLMVIMFA